MKKTLLAVAVSAFCAVSGAQAATDWGVHDTDEIAFSGLLSGSISEIFTFSLLSTTSLSTSLDVSSNDGFKITDGMVWLYKENGATDTFLSAYAGTGNLFSAFNLDAGDYYYKVTGLVTGPRGGFFTLASTTAPVAVVPEADTYAMMLAGLGMIGLMAKRRMG